MALILGLDLETSGLDPQEDCILEVGLVDWDIEARQPVRMKGFLVKPDREISDEKWAVITGLNGITKELVDLYGLPPAEALRSIKFAMRSALAVVAFNGDEFDRLFYLNLAGADAHAIPWVDTRLDCAKPRQGSLILQCAMAGFLNPFPHRSVTDVLSMFKLISDDGEDFHAMIERAKIPNIIVGAVGLPFERKDEAKDRGYFWDAPARLWKKKIKACDLAKEGQESGFRVVEVK
jgi:DNA polymerase III subunit epsilon